MEKKQQSLLENNNSENNGYVSCPEDELRDALSKSLWAFSILGMRYNDLSTIHKKICDLLQRPSTRKLIVVPRGFFKSSLVSVAYPLWLACKDPSVRILLLAKNQNNAGRRVRMIRVQGIEKNPLLPFLYPHLLPKNIHKVRWSDLATCVERPVEYLEATFESAGINTALPSRHYNFIICDDTIAADSDEMTDQFILPTPDELRKAIGFHKMLETLLVPPVDKQTIIYVATRWDRQDVVQYILDNEKDDYDTLISGATNPDGSAVFPELFPLETLAKIRERLGSQMYSLQYDNIPLSAEDHMVQPGQIRQYHKCPDGLQKVITVDPAISPKSGASQAVIMVGGVDKEGNLYVVDYIAKRGYTPAQLVDSLFALHKGYLPYRVGIESVAYQGSLIHYIKEEMKRRNYSFHIEELKPKGIAKDVRIRRLQPLIEGGRLWIKPEHGELLSQLYDYPASRSASYDLLDVLAYQLDLLIFPSMSKPSQPKAESLWTLEEILKDIKEKSMGRLPFCLQ